MLAISEIVSAFKAEHPGFGEVANGTSLRQALLERLAASGVVYVPAFYDVEYLADGRIGRVVPTNSAAPWRVAKHTLMDLDEWPYPKNPLVPLAETVHERLSVEIFRGCTRGCRFCQAGMITRPVRERSTEVLGEMIENGLRRTGFEEVGMLSLSSADHSRDRRALQGPGRPVRVRAGGAVPAQHPGGRLQHRPGQRAVAQRPALRADVRPRGGQRADAPGDQQDGHRGGPDQHGDRRLLRGLAAGEAVLHVRPADRDRRGRPADRRAREERDQGRTGGRRHKRHPVHRVDRRVRAQAAHAVPVGRASSTTRAPTAGCDALRDEIRNDRNYGRAIGFRYHDGRAPGSSRGCSPGATGGWAG